MSKAIIDTSTITNVASLGNHICYLKKLDNIIKLDTRNVFLVDVIENFIEAFIFYDDVLIDFKSIAQSSDLDIVKPILNESYCISIVTEDDEYNGYKNIIESLGYSDDEIARMASAIEHNCKNLVDPHGNMIIPKYLRNDSGLKSYYSADLNDILDDIIKSNQDSLGCTIPKNIVYEIVRYLYYLQLQIQEKAFLVIHPSRANIPIAQGNRKNLFNMLMDRAHSIYNRKISQRCSLPWAHNAIPLPFIAAYVLNRVDRPYQLSEVINDVRDSKEGRKFRKRLNELFDIINEEKNDEMVDIQNEINQTLMYWEDNLNIVPGFRKRSLTIITPFISTNLDIRYIGGNKIARNLLTLVHKTILNKNL